MAMSLPPPDEHDAPDAHTEPDAHGAPAAVHAEHPWSFRFRTGRPALDLAATLVGYGDQRAVDGRERLLEPAYLDRWLYEAGLPLPPSGNSTDRDLERLRTAREQLYRGIFHRVERRPLPPQVIADINELATSGHLRPLLDAGGRQRVLPARAHLTDTLAYVAADLIDILANVDDSRLKRCAAPRCDLVFVDATRSGTRRWCSMRPCGDRMNAQAYRARARRDSPRHPAG